MKNPIPDVLENSPKVWISLTAFILLVPSFAFSGLALISTRHKLGSEESNNTVLVDFEIAADTDILFRHIGPTLANFGVPGTLPDPVLEVYDATNNMIGSNDHWGDAANAAEMVTASAAVGAFVLDSASSDAALLMPLGPGKYRVKIFSDTGVSGTSISEVYATSPRTVLFKTISIEASGNSPIGRPYPGFLNVFGSSSIMIRALGVGPGASSDPSITVQNPDSTIVISNDNWDDGPDAALINPLSTAVGFSPLLVPGSSDSAVLIDSLEPGVYIILNPSDGRIRIEIADVTSEIEPEPIVDPLIGGASLPGFEDWFHSDWFGYYGTAFAPWLLHIEHGAIYRHPDSTNASLFIYDDAMSAWWWTNEGIYPSLYRFTDGSWLWYQEWSKNPRWFINLSKGGWESW